MKNFKQEVTHPFLLNTSIILGSFSTQERAFYAKEYSKYLFNKHIKKKGKASHLIQKSIIKSLTIFSPSKKNSKKLRIKRSLLDAVNNDIKDYALNQKDINDIARIEYNYFNYNTANYNEFKVLDSLSSLSQSNLKEFLSNPNQNRRLTLIINLEEEPLSERHWGVLIINNQKNYNILSYGYYSNIKNNDLPEIYKKFFYDKNINVLKVNSYFYIKKIENYNSGLWALETAADIHRMLDEELNFEWLRTKISRFREERYFSDRRKFFADKLNIDPTWRYSDRYKFLTSHKKTFSKADTSQPSDTVEQEYKRLKKETFDTNINFLLKYFSRAFTAIFLERVSAYYLEAKGIMITPEEIKKELKTGFIGCLAGASISQSIIGAIPSSVASARSLSNKISPSNIEKARKITKIFSILKDDGSLSLILSEIAVDIFYVFESQFIQLNDSAGDLITMEKLAEDAVDQSINYIENQEVDIEKINLKELIERGVLYGRSTKRFCLNFKKNKILSNGYLTNDIYGNPVEIENIYKKTGYVILGTSGSFINKFYSNNVLLCNRYGYRKPFDWEKEKNGDLKEIHKKFHYEDFSPTEENDFKTNSIKYEYILKEEEKPIIINKIFNEIKIPSQNYQEVINKEPILFNLKNSINNFIGRTDKIIELHRYLTESEKAVAITHALSRLSVQDLSRFNTNPSNSNSFINSQLAVSGLGGIGKTQLALRYAEQYKESYDCNILWINAETKEDLSQSFLKLAKKIKISNIDNFNEKKELIELTQEVYNYFSDRKSLFILDNVENFRVIEPYLPKLMVGNQPKILITSRYSNWQNIAQTISLDVFSESEAQSFIKQELQIQDSTQDNKIKELSTLLQYMPLALQQALAYIKVQRKTYPDFFISEYLEYYKEKSQEQLDFEFSNFNNDPYLKTIFNTWSITLYKIRFEYLGQEAIDILNIMAYLSPENISNKNFLFKYMGDDYIKYKNIAFIMDLLNSYSMINLEREIGKYSIHRLVQQVLRINLEQNFISFKRIVKMINELTKFYDLNNQEQILHYLHFLLYMSEYEEKLKDIFPEGVKQIIFSKYEFLETKHWNYFFDLAYLNFPKEKFLKFLASFITYSIKIGSDIIPLVILTYLEKQLELKIISKENIKYIFVYSEIIRDKHIAPSRISSNAERAKMQRIISKVIFTFKQSIFKENYQEYENCIPNVNKRSVCSLTRYDLDKIQKNQYKKRVANLIKIKKYHLF